MRAGLVAVLDDVDFAAGADVRAGSSDDDQALVRIRAKGWSSGSQYFGAVGIRLVVAGSPYWPAAQAPVVSYALALHLAEWTQPRASEFVLLAGMVRKGAESVARDFWVQSGGRVWKYPPDWKADCDPAICNHGPRRPNGHGGQCPWVIFRRNTKMLGQNPERCLSFITPEDDESWLLTEMAVQASVHTTVHSSSGVWDVPPGTCQRFLDLKRQINQSTSQSGPATNWAARWSSGSK